MKTKLFVLVLLIANFSCTTTNKPVSDAEKEKIKGEIKEVVNSFLKGCADANFKMCLEPCLDSPDFIYVFNGNKFSYQDCVAVFEPIFNTITNQKITIVDEKYAFLDNPTIVLKQFVIL